VAELLNNYQSPPPPPPDEPPPLLPLDEPGADDEEAMAELRLFPITEEKLD